MGTDIQSTFEEAAAAGKCTYQLHAIIEDDIWIIIAQHLDGVSLARASNVSHTINNMLSDDIWQSCFHREGFRKRSTGWGLGECEFLQSWKSEYSKLWIQFRSPRILKTINGQVHRATPETVDDKLMESEDGDVIELSPGIYSAGLVISKNILLRAFGQRENITLRPPAGITAILCTAQQAVVSGLTIDAPDPELGSDRAHGAILIASGSLRVLDCDIYGSVISHTIGTHVELRGCNLARFTGAGVLADCAVRGGMAAGVAAHGRHPPATHSTANSVPPLLELRWGHTDVVNCIVDGAAGTGGDPALLDEPACGALVRPTATISLDGCTIRGCTVGLCVLGTAPPLAATARRRPSASLFAGDPPQLDAARCAVTDCRAAGVAVARAARVVLADSDVRRCGAGLRVARWARPALDGCRLRDRAVPGSCVTLDGCLITECGPGGGCGIEAVLDGGGLVRLLAP
jgi:hypothetical protein